MSVVIDEQYVRNHFERYCHYDRAGFFALISPTVHLRLMGSIPELSGDYHSADEFQTKVLGRIVARLDGKMTVKLTSCIVSGQQAAVEMITNVDSVKQKNGRPLPNVYCWVAHYDESGVVDTMRLYVDGVLINELMTNNPGP